MIELTWLAGPLGLVGLALAFLLHRRSGTRQGDQTSGVQGAGEDGAIRFVAGLSPIFMVVLVIVAALLWLSVSMPTAFATLVGGLFALAAGVFGIRSIAGAATVGGASGRTSVDPSGIRAMVGRPLAFGIALASLATLGTGALYFVLVFRPAAFLQSELVDFGNIVVGFGTGASVLALLVAASAGVLSSAAARPRSDGPAAAGEGRLEGTRRETRRVADLVAGVAGIGTDLLQSSLCATGAAIVIASAGNIYSAQRVAAVALPILISAAGLIASGLAIAGTRAFKGANPAGSLRTLGFVATAIFLVFAYFIVAALGMAGRDPYTGREHLLSGPFWSVFTGALAGVAIAFVTEYFTSWRPVRRLVEDAGGIDGTSSLRALAIGLKAAVGPLFLISVAVITAYYFSGPYGIAMSAVGMLGTVGIVAATSSFGFLPSGPSADVHGASSKAQRQSREMSVGLASIGGSTAAIGRGIAAAAAGITGIALFSAFSYATGLWAIGIDLQSPLVLAGLLIGTTIPVLVAASVLSGGRRVAGRIFDDGLAHPSGSSAQAGSAGTKDGVVEADLLPGSLRRSIYRELLLPAAGGLLLPPIVGYVLGVQAVGGLIAGCTLAGLVLALVLSSAGSSLVNAHIYERATVTGRNPDPEDAAIADVARALRDAPSPVINTVVKLIGITAIVLVPWFVSVL